MIPTPTQDGYFMPAEWHPQEATWLSWPHNRETWPYYYKDIPDTWMQIIKALTPHQKVHLNINNAEMFKTLEPYLEKHQINQDQLVLHRFHTDDVWIRDYGPGFLLHKDTQELALNNWGFNMWGGKYPPWDQDNMIPRRVSERYNIKSYQPGIILEGGSIEVNGAGCVLTTTSCLLNPNRNPQCNQKTIETYLCEYLGVNKVLWLTEGIVGDDTDGHIDDITRFVNETSIVTVIEDNKNDENYEALKGNLKTLETFTDVNGRHFDIHTLPMPSPVIDEGGQRLPASYANFLIANNIVLVPVFNDVQDEKALRILDDLFPDREIIPILSRSLVEGLGGIHCISQQQPKSGHEFKY